jgi:hypothetical protein
MNSIKLFLGAVIITGFGFGAGYYCAADSARDRPDIVTTSLSTNTEQLVLEAQLAEAVVEIKKLQADARVSGNRQSSAASGSASEAYADLRQKLDKLPEPFIAAMLKEYLGPDSLQKVTDTRAFSKRLLEVALDDQTKPAEDENEVVSADIEFSRSPIHGKNMIAQDIALAQFEPVFAHILTSEQLGNVILKWQDVNTGEIVLFTSMNIGSGGQSVSAVPSAGWQNSVYRVSLSSMDDSVQLMASNAYTVSHVQPQNGPRTPNKEYIQDLITLGQAVPKSQ